VVDGLFAIELRDHRNVPVLVTVTNTLDCNKPRSRVAKKVVNNTGGPLPPACHLR